MGELPAQLPDDSGAPPDNSEGADHAADTVVFNTAELAAAAAAGEKKPDLRAELAVALDRRRATLQIAAALRDVLESAPANIVLVDRPHGWRGLIRRAREGEQATAVIEGVHIVTGRRPVRPPPNSQLGWQGLAYARGRLIEYMTDEEPFSEATAAPVPVVVRAWQPLGPNPLADLVWWNHAGPLNASQGYNPADCRDLFRSAWDDIASRAAQIAKHSQQIEEALQQRLTAVALQVSGQSL